MGCHTWFYRPITEKEFELMKDYAPIEISDLINEDYIKVLKKRIKLYMIC